MGMRLIQAMDTKQKQDEKDRKDFLDSVSVSELDPVEAEIALMQMFPKLVRIDIVLED